jgi:hypothetical protein
MSKWILAVVLLAVSLVGLLSLAGRIDYRYFQIIRFFLLIALYFLPALIANGRRAQSYNAILVLNLLLGWTILGWIGAICWALAGDPKPPRQSIIESR